MSLMFPTLPTYFHTALEDLQTYPPDFASLIAENQLNRFFHENLALVRNTSLEETDFHSCGSVQEAMASPEPLTLQQLYELHFLPLYPQKNSLLHQEKLNNVLKVFLFIYRSAVAFYRKNFLEWQEERREQETNDETPFTIDMSQFLSGMRKITQLSKEWLQVIISPFHRQIDGDLIRFLESEGFYSAKLVQDIDYRVSLAVQESNAQSNQNKLSIMVRLRLNDDTCQVLKIDSFRQLKELENIFTNIEKSMGMD